MTDKMADEREDLVRKKYLSGLSTKEANRLDRLTREIEAMDEAAMAKGGSGMSAVDARSLPYSATLGGGYMSGETMEFGSVEEAVKWAVDTRARMYSVWLANGRMVALGHRENDGTWSHYVQTGEKS